MFDRVMDRFLGDEIKVRRGQVVPDGDRLGAIKHAVDLPFLLDTLGQVGQRGHEPLGINGNRKQPAHDGPKLSLAALQSPDHLVRPASTHLDGLFAGSPPGRRPGY